MNDRRLAAIAWGGILFGGPLLPLIVLLVSSPMQPLSQRHARIALRMWASILAAWIPFVVLVAASKVPSNWLPKGALVAGASVTLFTAIGLFRLFRAEDERAIMPQT